MEKWTGLYKQGDGMTQGNAEVDVADERNVLQMPASVLCWKGVSERAATATVMRFIFLTLGNPKGLCCVGQKISQGKAEKQEDKSFFGHQGKK